MKFCSQCGNQLQEGQNVCPNCGATFSNNGSTNIVINNYSGNGGNASIKRRDILTAILLSIITCGIYGYYWAYTMGKKMKIAGDKNGISVSDNGILYLVLQFLGLGILIIA